MIYCKIKKRLGQFVLDVDFEAEVETVALMGASGCGKSMTLKCISGIEKPDEGRIIINGQEVFNSQKKINVPVQKRNVGYLFQDYALFPNMTVLKNIMVAMPKGKRKNALEYIKVFNLEGLENHYPKQLSGGQKQRCALARMVASEPEIIMLDEPFSAMDTYLKWEMEREIEKTIKKYNKTVLFVSHNRDEVYRLSDKVVVIHKGKSEKITSKDELYFNPKTYTAALLTGCKNIAKVYINDNKAEVRDYGLEFKITDKKIKYVGIRANHILPAFMAKNSDNFIFARYETVNVIEEVFSYTLMIRTDKSQVPLVWEVSKNVYEDLKNHKNEIAVDKNNILLLY